MEALSNMEKTLGTKMKGMPFASHVSNIRLMRRLKRVICGLPDVVTKIVCFFFQRLLKFAKNYTQMN